MLLLQLLREIGIVMSVEDYSKSIKCTVFEDNNGTVEIANTLKMRPRTKHADVKCHHFSSFVSKGDIKIIKVDTSEQETDFF